ncbi:MAG TPA: PQQ-dependent sugar dehydrogenase [Actinomycetota bacterium]|nr:PQQ-dependent sugar dehydrogenase [Actinomycetota bacterium]
MRRALPAVVLTWAVACAAGFGPGSDPGLEPVATGLGFPTNLAFLPDGTIVYGEKDTGRIRLLSPDGTDRVVARLPVLGGAERGLLGLAIHPRFPEEPWLYVYYSDARTGRNRLVRVRLAAGRAGSPEALLELLPAVSGYHNGGDLAFGLDGMLYVSTGEAHEPARARDPDDLGGKVLRLAPDGSVPPDNPFPGSPVYTLGHRNSFGLCVNPGTGDVWETENGPDRDDEVNLLRPGGDHGWPAVLGPGGGPGFVDPEIVFPQVIVPTGCAFTAPDTMWFGDFRGDLHRARLGGPDLDRVREHRVVLPAGAGITDVAVGPDGRLYVATATAILRVTGVRARTGPAASPTGGPTASPTATRAASPTAPAPGTPGPVEPGRGRAGTAATLLVAALLLAALVWSSRRLRPPRA